MNNPDPLTAYLDAHQELAQLIHQGADHDALHCAQHRAVSAWRGLAEHQRSLLIPPPTETPPMRLRSAS